MKNVSILGLGYVGLPTAAVIANSGYRVFGYDINQRIIDEVNNCSAQFSEPSLDELVAKTVKNGTLSAHSTLQPADFFLICVPTPIRKGCSDIFQPDISHVIRAAEEIAKVIQDGNCVILESTSPIGTTEKIKKVVEEKSGIKGLSYAYSPERIIPGNTIFELQNNSRVIGGLCREDTENVSTLYKDFVLGELSLTNAKTAEMCKLAENAYRDVNIAFANELSIICDTEGIDAAELIKIANLHPRVEILNPGIGVGGHCIAVDPWFLISNYTESTHTIHAARKTNNRKTLYVIDQILELVNDFHKKNEYKPKVVLYGLAYKPDIDDLRESPAIEIATELMAHGIDISCVEPHITSLDKFNLVDFDAAMSCDLHIELVKHSQFRDLFDHENLGEMRYSFVIK